MLLLLFIGKGSTLITFILLNPEKFQAISDRLPTEGYYTPRLEADISKGSSPLHKVQGPVQNKNTGPLFQILFRIYISVTVTSQHWAKHKALLSSFLLSAIVLKNK